MVFPHDLLTFQTWRYVGIGLSTTVFALGALAAFAPETAAASLSIIPTTPESRTITQKSMLCLGARDMVTAAALLWFHVQVKQREMGLLIGSWAVVCAADVWIAAQGPNGWDQSIWTLCFVTGLFGLGGVGLMQT